MKAVRVNEWGQPIQLEDVPQPTPGSDEVLVRVRAASVNPVDGGIAAGYMASFLTTPVTLGADFAGDVVAIGNDVQHVKPGDAVYGMSPAYGTFAEYAVVKRNGVAHKPKTLDYLEAAAVPLVGLTAWQTLFNIAELKSGERILIHGAGGGIGLLAVQLAKNAGAYVIAHDKGDKKALLLELGADQFIDAETQRFEDLVSDLDVILDLVGRELVERSWNVCRPGSRYVTPAAQFSQEEAARRGINASGTFTQPTVEELTKLAQEIDAGRLKVYVNRTFPLENIQTALAYKQEGGIPGKVVVSVN
jgi:NADPH:quinone reductase-like Zn-dependent oxidoreductase